MDILAGMIHFMRMLRAAGKPERRVRRAENLIGAWSDYLADRRRHDVNAISTADIDAWLGQESLTPRAQKARQALLSEFLTWAQQHGKEATQ